MKTVFRVVAGICLACILTGCGQNVEVQEEALPLWEPVPETAGAQESTDVPAAEEETPEPAAAEVQTEAGKTAEASTEPAAEGETVTEEAAGGSDPVSISSFVSSSEALSSMAAQFMDERGLNADNFAVSYKNLQTGEVFYFNELKQWDACSTYKLPLNLLYYDMEAEGQMTEDTIVPGTNTPLSECHHQSLEFSNNELSEAMMNNLGSYDQVKRNMRKYFTLTDEEIDSSYYYHNYFCARMMMEIAEYVYTHQRTCPDALNYLLAAQPGMYFRKYLPSGVQIAQKYGLRDGYTHNAGIIFGRVPFVLSVYSYQAGGEDMIARCAELFYNYTEQQ